jgi:hypothetical protein
VSGRIAPGGLIITQSSYIVAKPEKSHVREMKFFQPFQGDLGGQWGYGVAYVSTSLLCAAKQSRPAWKELDCFAPRNEGLGPLFENQISNVKRRPNLTPAARGRLARSAAS